jgi:hypothetical protein
MPDGTQPGMSCAQFDAVLSDALDGILAGPQLESFQAHRQTCALCGPMFAEAEAGLRWLHELPDAEPPRHLVHNILAATSGVATAPDAAPAQASWIEKLRARVEPVFAPFSAALRSPRLVMSFGMAFFSISIALNVAGVNVKDVRYIDLRPSALQKQYYATTARLTRYYENIRFVYEIESRVRDLKRAAEPERPPSNPKEKNRKNDTSGRPEHKQNENYSRDASQPLLAAFPPDPTSMPVRAGRNS